MMPDISTNSEAQDAPAEPSSGVAAMIPSVVRKRTMSLLQTDMPRGMSGMTGVAAGQAPTLSEVKQGAYTTEGEERAQQFTTAETPVHMQARRARGFSNAADPATQQLPPSSNSASTKNGTIEEAATPAEELHVPTNKSEKDFRPGLVSNPTVYDLHRTASGTFPNGYRFPPKHTWREACAIGFKAFIKFTFGSLVGFLIVFYCVQVIGWGGMIFLLLCGAGDPRMCFLERPPGSGNYVKDCSSKHTSKSLWIEIDAQVLTGLFCVTAFGLAPWRCKDLWHLMQYRLRHEHLALRKLAAVHKGWFRLPGSHHLDPAIRATDMADCENGDAIKLVPHPLSKAAPPPLTGVRALPTSLWKMDFVVWMMFANTIFQVILCGFMWGQNRYVRPAWATALFIVLGMLSGMAAGWIQFQESKKIKQREGIPLKEADKLEGEDA